MILIKWCYRISFLVLLLTIKSFAYCQTKPLIRKSYAYFYETIVGALPKSGNNDFETVQSDTVVQPKQQRATVSVKKDTTIVVYVETKVENIVWESAWQNKHQLVITSLPLTTPFKAGFIKNAGEATIIPAKGGFLFELQFSKVAGKVFSPFKINGDPIILKAKYKRKTFIYKTAALQEIIPLPPA